jgi:hypothetical protein
MKFLKDKEILTEEEICRFLFCETFSSRLFQLYMRLFSARAMLFHDEITHEQFAQEYHKIMMWFSREISESFKQDFKVDLGCVEFQLKDIKEKNDENGST